MPPQPENTVFISYRRTNSAHARLLYTELTAAGYDCFLDYETIGSGDFPSIIEANIKARAHFLIVLTPSALERCVNTGDWLRREIELAVQTERNIVPLLFDGFDFRVAQKNGYLPGEYLPQIQNKNGPQIHWDLYKASIERVINQFLSQSVAVTLHPLDAAETIDTAQRAQDLQAKPAVTEAELTAEEWFERGYQAGDIDHDYPEAIRCYTKAIRLKPDDAAAHNNRGNAYTNQCEYAAAIRDYNEAIRLKPDFATAYNNRGNAYRNQGDYAAAMHDYTEAISLKPDDATAYNNRGTAYAEQGEYAAAMHDYNEAIRLKPDFAAAYYNRGNAYGRQGEYAAAIRDFDEAIRLKPDFATAYYNRGIAYTEQGDYPAAMRDFDDAIRLKPDDAGAYNNRAYALYEKGDPASLVQAIRDVSKALSLRPDNPNTLHTRGAIRMKMGDFAGAIQDFEAALAILPNDQEFKDDLERARQLQQEQNGD